MSCVSDRVQENRSGATSCRLRGSSTTSLNAPSNSKGGQSHSTSGSLQKKPCCLCWCCCCSCSCTTPAKTSEENGPGKHSDNPLVVDGEPPPQLEEIRIWGENFDRLMKHPVGRKVFREFLRCEYSEENIMFWLACEDLKRESSLEAIEEKTRIIYEDYISILSPKEVSLDSRVREIVNRNMVEPSPNTFDEAQLQIYTLMHRDSYPRFVNSNYYKKLAQLPLKEDQSEGDHHQGGRHS